MSRTCIFLIAHGLCLLLVGAPFAEALTRYVSPTGNAIAPFTNWNDAAQTIQAAVDEATNGDVVLVGNGEYTTGFRTTPGANVLNRLVITKNITVQSLNGASNTVIAGDRWSTTDPIRCVYMSGNASLIGFTLTNGGTRITGPWPKDICGGGLYLDSNTGGGAYDCVISGNRASTNGHGGGVLTENSSAEIVHCVISGNEAGGGGGMLLEGGAPLLHGLLVRDNQAQGGGGGLLFYHADSPVRSVLVVGNTSTIEGGGLYFDGCSPLLDNVTVADNSAPTGRGGGLEVSFNSHPVLRNCILWNNTDEQIAFNPGWNLMQISISHSDVQGGEGAIVTYGKGPVNWLAGNLDEDPLFLGPGNYQLQAASPCVDLGENQPWMTTATDLGGLPRIVNGIVDMGAWENGADSDIYIRVSAVDVVWFGYVGKTYQVQGATNLGNPTWENLGEPVAGTGAFMYVMDIIRDTGRKFYRVIEDP